MGNAHIRHVDGLRAVAVLAVMVYHLFPKWLPGGLAGVDVFFAISGFVVTASLAQHRDESLGRFIGGFYHRRVTRILPALVAVLLVTAIVYVLFIPASWLSNSNERIAFLAFFGLSNFGLQDQSDSYFSPRAEFNPFTHTWSLGVEEQFYLIAPWLLFWQVFRRRNDGERAAHPWSILAISVISLALMVRWAKLDPLLAFYSIGGRLCELAAGCLWFLYVWANRGATRNLGRSWWLDAVGVLLLATVLFLTDAASFPFPWALVAVASAICLIGLPQDPSPIRSSLARRMPVWIGLRSYSLYLWHWPVYVLMRWTVGLDRWWTWLVAFGSSFVLAAISYRWVESPVRKNRKWLTLRPAIGILIAVSVTAMGAFATDRMFKHRDRISLSTVSRHGVDWYAADRDLTIAEENFHCRTEAAYRTLPGAVTVERRPIECDDKAIWLGRKIFVFGDSHATVYVPMLHRLAADTGMSATIYSLPGCPFLNLRFPMKAMGTEECVAKARSALEDVLRQSSPGDIVFLSSLRVPRFVDQWGRFDEKEAWRQVSPELAEERRIAVEDAMEWLQQFESKQMRVVFEAPTPVFHSPAFRCADGWNAMNELCSGGLEVPRAEAERYRKVVVDSMRELASRSAVTSIFDPLTALCDAQTCSAISKEGRPLFFDADHLSRYGNEVVYPGFRSFLETSLEYKPAQRQTLNLRVINWGPKETVVRTPFNAQPDGRSALWIQIDGLTSGTPVVLFFGGQMLENVVVSDKLVTTSVPDALFEQSGSREFVLEAGGVPRQRLVIGSFEVKSSTTR
jgi:peptidoglycan/LPS O-acetylase OafA/YrhL